MSVVVCWTNAIVHLLKYYRLSQFLVLKIIKKLVTLTDSAVWRWSMQSPNQTKMLPTFINLYSPWISMWETVGCPFCPFPKQGLSTKNKLQNETNGQVSTYELKKNIPTRKSVLSINLREVFSVLWFWSVFRSVFWFLHLQ